MAQEEAKRENLRNRLNAFYGIDPTGLDRSDPKYQRDDMEVVPGEQGDIQQMVRRFDASAYDADLAAARARAAAAREQLASEEREISGANRDYYSDQLKRASEAAARRNRFALADRGLLRGSVDIDTGREHRRATTEGAVRVEDEVRAALAALRSQRETERANSVQLIQSGVGEDAVLSAAAGRDRALENVRSRQKADITSDLFSVGADNALLARDPNALAVDRYRQRLSTYYPTSTRTSGRQTKGK